jgi:hypothetical protein
MRWRDFIEEKAVEGRLDFLSGVAGAADKAVSGFCAARSFLYAELLGPGMEACFLLAGLTNRMRFSLGHGSAMMDWTTGQWTFTGAVWKENPARRAAEELQAFAK